MDNFKKNRSITELIIWLIGCRQFKKMEDVDSLKKIDLSPN